MLMTNNARIKKDNKIIFTEQDIVIDNIVQNRNIDVTVQAEYFNSGIGIALITESVSLHDSQVYLFKIGHNNYSVIKRNGEKVEVLENSFLDEITPYVQNITLRLKKINNKFYFYVQDKLVTVKTFNIERYKVGYYSNAGNCIKSIDMAIDTPIGWNVNMRNTQGGYVFFYNDKFEFKDCYNNAEIEQEKILIKKGVKYFLKYEKGKEKDNDIVPYVFLSDDDRWEEDSVKNILNRTDNSILLKEDSNVNLKFTGTNGSIRNISITDNINSNYLSTTYQNTESKSSVIKVSTEDIVKIEFVAKVTDYKKNDYSILKDVNTAYSIEDLRIELDKEYTYEIHMKDALSKDVLFIDGTEIVKMNINDELIMFNNVDAEITKLILYKSDNSTVNAFASKIKKQFVPGSITSPIVIITENDDVLDLSSSYREINSRFIFTNIEREIFEPTNILKLENKISEEKDSITVYAIYNNSKIDEENLYKAKALELREIDDYANIYDIIYEDEIYKIDRDNSTIILSEDDKYLVKYKEIIVDYKKKDSYSVNYNMKNRMYEVDISSDSNIKIKYDIEKDEDNFMSTSEYKPLNIEVKPNSYIVVKGA